MWAFNAVYAQALTQVRNKLSKASIVLIIKSADNKPFWSDVPSSQRTDEHEVVEATFVDDEALVLVASSPKSLDKAINCLLEAVTEVFERFLLKMNWAKGKSEALLRYRGD